MTNRGSKSLPESASTDRVEDFLPGCSRSSDGASTSVNRTERAGVREHLLAQGKELAAQTILVYERWARAPFNSQEAAQVRGLQKQFADWEHMVKVQCPDMDTAALFPDSRLRPFQREVTVNDIARLRKTPSPLEAHFQSVWLATAREEKKSTDSEGIWSGLPGGI